MNSSAAPSCLYCGGADFKLLYREIEDRLRFAPGAWTFLRCDRCGSGILSPFPWPEELAAFYPPVYSFTTDIGDRSRLKRTMAWLEYRLYFRPQYRAQVRRVLSGIGQTSARHSRRARLLDVGCGRGLRLLGFRELGFDVQGMDFQPEVVRYLQNELHIPAVCTDITGLQTAFAPSSFDLITGFYVLEHVPDVAAMLRTCWNLLAPGGWLVATVPLLDGNQSQLFGSRWTQVTEAPRHLSLPTQLGLSQAFVKAGFSQVSIRPDSVLTHAGLVGLSLLPGAAATHSYGTSKVAALLKRLVAAGISIAAIPWCLIENYLLRRPSLGMIFGRKPVHSA